MLEASDLSFGFPGRTIGRGIGFTLGAGEVMCVLGPNGGGKTTLFRTLLGLLPSHAGKILLQNDLLESLSRGEIARRVGYVPQGHAAYFAFTVREFVLMGRTAHLGVFASPATNDFLAVNHVLESLGIAALADRPVTEISGGERQLALLARALAQQPRLLVLDEPTAGLDFGNQIRVLEKISNLSEKGISILFSSHHPDHAFMCAGRALLLAEGRALEIGRPQEVIRADTLQRLYGVPAQVLATEAGVHAFLPRLTT